MNKWYWFVLDVNPEPWAIGPVSVGRKGKSMYPIVGRNTQLHMYKEAIKEAIGHPEVFFEGKIELRLIFWRSRDEYKTHQARTHRKHEADVTNMQKATEDALQGILFKNDKDVNDVHSTVVEQGPGVKARVVVGIRQGVEKPSVMDELPLNVQMLLDEMDNEADTLVADNEWG